MKTYCNIIKFICLIFFLNFAGTKLLINKICIKGIWNVISFKIQSFDLSKEVTTYINVQ